MNIGKTTIFTRRAWLAAAIISTATCLAVVSPARADLMYVSYGSTNSIELFDTQTGADLGSFASGGGLSFPQGLALDGSGNLYVANAGNGTISKIAPGGSVSLFASGLSTPLGLALDGSGNLYAANNGNNTISKIAPDGSVSLFASGGGLSFPLGLAVDGGDNVYVAQISIHDTILKITPGGSASQFFSAIDQLIPSGAYGLAFDSSGTLYASILFEKEIVKIAPDGSLLGTLLGGLSEVNGLAFDSSGNLYAANGVNTPVTDKITEFMPDGSFSIFASTSSFPSFIAIQAVPDTGSTLMLMGLGLASVGFLRRKIVA